MLKTEEHFEFCAVVDGAWGRWHFFQVISPSLSSPLSLLYLLSRVCTALFVFSFFLLLQVVLHVCDASSWFFLQYVSLNILISMLRAGFLLISALFEAVLLVLRAFFSMKKKHKPQLFPPPVNLPC